MEECGCGSRRKGGADIVAWEDDMAFFRFVHKSQLENRPDESESPAYVVEGRTSAAAPISVPVPVLSNEAGEARIERIGTGEGERVRISVEGLLKHLPSELRGPAWKEAGVPRAAVEFDKATLLERLRSGHVRIPLDEFASFLPPGWIRPDPELLVEMDLPSLVSTLPASWIQVDSELDVEARKASRMRALFKPAAAGDTPAEIPLPGGVEAPRPRRRPPILPAWDGLDREPDAGAETVDMNRAGIGEIAKLPAMGVSSARRIVEFRAANGPFSGIYDLLRVPGVGTKVFQRMTGLDHRLRKRSDRHGALNAMLGLPQETRPSLNQIATAIAAALKAAGCLLATNDGFILAKSEGLGTAAERLAALSPKIYRRTRRYMRQITRDPVHAIALPAIDPPLLMILSANCHLVILEPPEGIERASLKQAFEISRELKWLLSRRAIVCPVEQAG
jgi:competence ComEA-like helix-hairpin-helix protein